MLGRLLLDRFPARRQTPRARHSSIQLTDRVLPTALDAHASPPWCRRLPYSFLTYRFAMAPQWITTSR